jgi:hypothetical protein
MVKGLSYRENLPIKESFCSPSSQLPLEKVLDEATFFFETLNTQVQGMLMPKLKVGTLKMLYFEG